MAAGAAVAAEAVAAVAEVGSARQFEELLSLKAKYAGAARGPGSLREAGRGLWTRGRPASAARLELSSRPNGGGPGRALEEPVREGSAAGRGGPDVRNGPASQRLACGTSRRTGLDGVRGFPEAPAGLGRVCCGRVHRHLALGKTSQGQSWGCGEGVHVAPSL